MAISEPIVAIPGTILAIEWPSGKAIRSYCQLTAKEGADRHLGAVGWATAADAHAKDGYPMATRGRHGHSHASGLLAPPPCAEPGRGTASVRPRRLASYCPRDARDSRLRETD